MGKPQSEVKKKNEKKEKPPISRMWVCKYTFYQQPDDTDRLPDEPKSGCVM